MPSLVQGKRLDEIDLAFERISEHDRRKGFKIGCAAARIIALISAVGGEQIIFTQVLRKVLRRRVGRADKNNVRTELRAYRIGNEPVMRAAEQQRSDAL